MKNALEYKHFYGTVEFSSEDEIFFGKIIGINDLVTFEGESVSSLKKAFEEAVDDYIDLCEEVGKPPLKSFKGTFNVRLSTELHRQAFMQASIHGMSLNSFVESAISEKVCGVAVRESLDLIGRGSFETRGTADELTETSN